MLLHILGHVEAEQGLLTAEQGSARALHSSVLPTPVGPRKRKQPVGRSGSFRPTRPRRTARATAFTASSWPTTRRWRASSRWSSRWLSAWVRVVTGTPVQPDTTAATSSAVTAPVFWPERQAAFSRSSSLRKSSSASRSMAAFSKSWPRMASSFSRRASATFSSRVRSSGGVPSRSIRTREAASSMRSMALSGRRRSPMYRVERATAASMAPSVIWRRWWASYRSRRPRRMAGRCPGRARAPARAGTAAPGPRPSRYTSGTRRWCGADDLQLPPAQGGLDDVGRVDGPLGGARPHDGVELVDEEDDVAHPAHLGQDVLHPLLKFPPVLGARHHGGEIQGHEALGAQLVGHVPGHHPAGQALGHGGLAHAGLADEGGVVLLPAGEDLDDPLDLLLPAHHRIQHAPGGQAGEIPGELLQQPGVAAILPLPGLSAPGRERGRPRRPWRPPRRRGAAGLRPHAGEHPHRHAVPLPEDAQQQVLGAHIVVAQPGRLRQESSMIFLHRGVRPWEGRRPGRPPPPGRRWRLSGPRAPPRRPGAPWRPLPCPPGPGPAAGARCPHSRGPAPPSPPGPDGGQPGPAR